MGRDSRLPRTLPFNGFSRGLPIIGEPKPPEPAAAAGKWHYHVPVLVQRDGRVEADSFQVAFPQKMGGAEYYGTVREYERRLVAAELKADTRVARLLRTLRLRSAVRLRVVPLQPVLLGFVDDPKPEAAPEPAAPASDEGGAA